MKKTFHSYYQCHNAFSVPSGHLKFLDTKILNFVDNNQINIPSKFGLNWPIWQLVSESSVKYKCDRPKVLSPKRQDKFETNKKIKREAD